MKYALLFTALGLAICLWGVWNQGWAWLAIWPGIAFLAVGVAYGLQAHRFWHKSDSGAISSLRFAALVPYNTMLWLIWHAHRRRSREAVCDLVISASDAAGPVWLGRWPYVSELPTGTSLVVDLLAEWPARRGICDGRTYRSYPLLDGCAPFERQQFLRLVEEIAAHPGTAYLHCALGHGRSGLLAAAVLLRRRLAADADDAVLKLKAVRPGVRLNRVQMRFLRSVAAELTGE